MLACLRGAGIPPPRGSFFECFELRAATGGGGGGGGIGAAMSGLLSSRSDKRDSSSSRPLTPAAASSALSLLISRVRFSRSLPISKDKHKIKK